MARRATAERGSPLEDATEIADVELEAVQAGAEQIGRAAGTMATASEERSRKGGKVHFDTTSTITYTGLE